MAFQSALAQGNCSIDLSSVTSAISSAQSAAQGGKTQDALTALGQARAAIDQVEQGCVTGQQTQAASATSPNCTYLFDATVREGTDKGFDLKGSLALVQDSDTSASGFVIPPGGSTADPSMVVPVTAQINGTAITLTFSLPNNQTITGTGTMEAPISKCAGTMSGDFTGPSADDKGDWQSGADLSNCISAGVSACVKSAGGNGSKACAISAVATCKAS